MIDYRPIALLLCVALLGACAKEVPPRSVSEFLDDELLLEAVLLRCTENRTESRYDAECVNAREAVGLLEAQADANRRAELEALSERKRAALRRTQQAAAEARRRAAEAAKRREELAYQAQFGMPLTGTGAATDDAMRGNEAMAVIPAPTATSPTETGMPSASPVGDNVPVAQVPPPAEDDSVDLEAIRKEMRRRKEEDTAVAADP
jgi:hypothetical protein